jgi:hypothetical protein
MRPRLGSEVGGQNRGVGRHRFESMCVLRGHLTVHCHQKSLLFPFFGIQIPEKGKTNEDAMKTELKTTLKCRPFDAGVTFKLPKKQKGR